MNPEGPLSNRLMSREWLTLIRKKALRRRVWFTVLSRLERCVVDLTIRCVDRVRSERLALVIGRIMCKVLKAFRSGFMEKVEIVGYDLAERISRIVVNWGYTEALSWKRDLTFVRCLGVNAVNNSSGWGQV